MAVRRIFGTHSVGETFALVQNRLRLENNNSWYHSQQRLPTTIKHRSRIHYWLADREAIKKGAGGIGLLVDQAKRIGDCSIANVLIVDHEHRWITPDQDFAHQGTTLRQSMELLGKVGVDVQSRPVAYEEAVKAKEIVLVGSTGVVWSASTLE